MLLFSHRSFRIPIRHVRCCRYLKLQGGGAGVWRKLPKYFSQCMAGYYAHAAGRRDADDGIRTSSSGQFTPPLLHKIKIPFRTAAKILFASQPIATPDCILCIVAFQWQNLSQLIDRLNLNEISVVFWWLMQCILALHNYCLDKNFVTYYFEYGHPFEESKI